MLNVVCVKCWSILLRWIFSFAHYLTHDTKLCKEIKMWKEEEEVVVVLTIEPYLRNSCWHYRTNSFEFPQTQLKMIQWINSKEWKTI